MKMILVGCGGTGVELLKISRGIASEVLVIDHDRVNLTNLHRLFMFTSGDRGEYKSQKASEFVSKMYGIKASFLTQRIEEVSVDVLDRYDVIFGALDNIEGRMNLNLMFRRSKCRLLIDCGISGYKAHAKAVYRGSSCLYCIRELYREDGVGICSLSSLPEKITSENREKVLRSLVELRRDFPGNRKEKIEQIVNEFNALAEEKLRTDVFDVSGMYDGIMPNVCFINSICASLAYKLLDGPNLPYDFIFYTGEENIALEKLCLGRDEECIVCCTDT
ncbi:sumo-activating enzyme enzyme subunit 2 [Encephalitozoon hellem]|uniref:Sumo-activating enzyme enzyme subunit 2 n=1 Tax=Encephalitozoon hellem TaxID=27973 RepID=A0ABY8CKP7_ENCHE|nr:sumo-activating enzyme enzyme subunit 2 [Encephalitozoon hellem]